MLVRVREDERFLREGDDLITALDVPAPLAALGATLEVATLDGTAPVQLPAGTQPGEVITLRGQGMPALRRGPARRSAGGRQRRDTPPPDERSSVSCSSQLNETLTEENMRSQESMFAKLRRALGSQAA